MHKQSLFFVGKVLISLLVLAFVLRSVSPDAALQTLRSANWTLLSLATLMFFPAQWLASYRWYFLLNRLGCDSPFWLVARYYTLGQISTLFLPGQLSGDVVRMVAISAGKTRKAAFGLSIMIDKGVLFVALTTYALWGAISAGPLSRMGGLYWAALACLVASATMVALLCRYRGSHVALKLRRIGQKMPPPAQAAINNFAGLTTLPTVPWRTMWIVLAYAFCLQMLNVVGSFFIGLAMGISINPIDWIAVTAIAALAQILPFTLGGLGIREGVFAGLLSLYAVPVATATVYSLTGYILVALMLFPCWLIVEFMQTHSRPSGKTFSDDLR
jgi:glycosyltransferase 2 family protein